MEQTGSDPSSAFRCLADIVHYHATDDGVPESNIINEYIRLHNHVDERHYNFVKGLVQEMLRQRVLIRQEKRTQIPTSNGHPDFTEPRYGVYYFCDPKEYHSGTTCLHPYPTHRREQPSIPTPHPTERATHQSINLNEDELHPRNVERPVQLTRFAPAPELSRSPKISQFSNAISRSEHVSEENLRQRISEHNQTNSNARNGFSSNAYNSQHQTPNASSNGSLPSYFDSQGYQSRDPAFPEYRSPYTNAPPKRSFVTMSGDSFQSTSGVSNSSNNSRTPSTRKPLRKLLPKPAPEVAALEESKHVQSSPIVDSKPILASDNHNNLTTDQDTHEQQKTARLSWQLINKGTPLAEKYPIILSSDPNISPGQSSVRQSNAPSNKQLKELLQQTTTRLSQLDAKVKALEERNERLEQEILALKQELAAAKEEMRRDSTLREPESIKME